MSETVLNLVEDAEVVLNTVKASRISTYFEEYPSCKGIVVQDESERPVGLVMRNHFYQKIGTQFGYSLYMNRPIELLMKTEIIKVDKDCDLATFGLKAMNRHENDVYDLVIVMDAEICVGVISISNFLAVMSEIKQREIELLNNQQRILKEANEQEKKYRLEIEQKNQSIKSLLNNADQGFLSFTEPLLISEEVSSVCESIFGKPISGLHFGDLMRSFLRHDTYEMLLDSLESLFQQTKKSRAKAYLKLLPETFKTDKRDIQIDYKLIAFNEDKKLMVILTDITDKIALEQKQQDEKNNMKLVLAALNNKTEILEAVEDARLFFKAKYKEILKESSSVLEGLSEVFRRVHTMKGDFALYAFHNTAVGLHVIEDQLAAYLNAVEPIDPTERIAGLELETYLDTLNFENIISKDIEIIENFLGKGYCESEKKMTVNLEQVELFIKAIEARFEKDDRTYLVGKIRDLTNPTLNEILLSYSDYVKILALKLNKSISEFQVTGSTVPINRKYYAGFLKSLIHIFRNIVDHGIESPEERVEGGKPEGGAIRCDLRVDHHAIRMMISDDGKGIDPEQIRLKAIEKNLYTPASAALFSDKEMIQTVFNADFSTQSKVSMLSGRGVGLYAVKTEVETLGGKVEVDSVRGEGTQFRMVLPLERI
ncbi:ATP-binding protein [Fusibacter sp. 3D3]|uniref:ATP-binding protein n=1 Tax=Fusibacter sp. 3D3 TaxID=1048380 RepID=UPI000852F726|nr:ATP-binding protein [Fusibacter sp. 3D3]GAU77394.1 signal transduction histidine kinase CheA [Fusibacter sp. 3D3]